MTRGNQDIRATLLESGKREFLEHGFEKASIRTICRNAGVTTGDATYTATYTATPAPAKTSTLTFNLAGGTLNGQTGKITVVAKVGDTVKLPGAPTKAGYTFQYWRGSQYKAGADYKVKGNHVFTAVWAENGSGSKDAIPNTGDSSGTVAAAFALCAIASLCLLGWSVRRRQHR